MSVESRALYQRLYRWRKKPLKKVSGHWVLKRMPEGVKEALGDDVMSYVVRAAKLNGWL